MNVPRIEILLPTAGKRESISNMFDSIMGQTYQDFRLTILADTEDTPSIWGMLAKTKTKAKINGLAYRGKVRVIEVPNAPLGNWGHSAIRWAFENLNDLAEWSYIVGDDDILLPKTLEIFARHFEGNEMVVGRALSIDRGDYRFNLILGNELKVNLITGSCCIYKTDIVRQVGYDDSCYASDWTIIEKFAKRGKFAHINSLIYVLTGPLG